MGGRVSESKGSVVPIEHIRSRILLVRGHKVLLDADLAALYGVTTKRFNEQVRRNAARFPEDFTFRLSTEEWDSLRSQFATLKTGRGQHRKYLPLAFTEHGAIMAATILNSPRATEVSVYVVRAFVRLRELLASNKELARRLDQLEKKLGSHDQAIAGLVNTIRNLMSPPELKRRPIGFVTSDEKKRG
ncbi:MAG TPA: ORF6N domain-containing protein [Burkholderiales bacterium]|nr:ORF6N domain-containing protein [Burkholderiales bacterium]